MSNSIHDKKSSDPLANGSALAKVATESDAANRRRETQKRFRSRSKSRSLAARSLLSSTQEQLQQADRQRGSLETRNRLLERFVFAQARPNAGPSYITSDAALERSKRWTLSSNIPDLVKTMLLPQIKLTCWGGQTHRVNADQISLMSSEAFSKLYTAAIGKLRGQLKRASSQLDNEELLASTLEVMNLYLCLVMSNPATARHIAMHSMLDGSEAEQQSHKSKTALALLAFSESQIQDLLAMRQLFLGQLGCLAAQRATLMQRMAQQSHQLAEVNILAAQLQANIADTHAMYLQNATALYLGVSTAWQFAIIAVTSYPFLPNHLMTEVLAEARGEPSLEAIVTQQCPQKRDLTWNHVSQYVSTISTTTMFRYTPFLSTVSQRTLCA